MTAKNIFKYGSLALILGAGVWLLLPPREKGPAQAARPDAGPARRADHVIRFSPGGYYTPDRRPYGIGEPLQGINRVIADFEARFPDTRIEVVNSPGLREYLVTQLSSGQAPDIISANVEDVWLDVQKGWYVPLDTFLEAPNPFVRELGDTALPGYHAWWDMFTYQAISRGKAAPDDGRNYCITFDMIETGIYYNKTLFQKLGLAVPETWEEFIGIMSRIKAAGTIPLLISSWSFSDWCVDLFFHQLYHGLMPGIDLMKDPVSEPYMDGYLDGFEIAFLRKKGFFTRRDPRFREMWRIMRALKDYTNPDLASRELVREFVTQRGAMYWYMPSLCYRLQADPHLGFEWGVFYLPPFTKKTSPYASEIPMCVIGGAGSQYTVTSSAVGDTDPGLPIHDRMARSQRLKRVINFLQFLCVPGQYEKVVNEYPSQIPNIAGVEPLPLLKPFRDILERKYTDTKWVYTFDLRFMEIQTRTLTLFLTGGIGFDEFLGWQEKNLASACRNLTLRKSLDTAAYQAAWDSLAPFRAAAAGLPSPAGKGGRP